MSESAENRPWRPNKDFYLSNPRSREIRGACLLALQGLERLMNDPEVAKDSAKKSELYAQIEVQNGKLIELGIRPEMHVGKPEEDFKANPVMTAEYLAGQLFDLMGIQIPSETEIVPIIQEHNELQEEKSIALVELSRLPKKFHEHAVNRTMLNFIEENFDIVAEANEQEGISNK